MPNIYGTNWASWNGNLDILKWLADLPQAVLPDIEGGKYGFKFLFDKGVLPDVEGANLASMTGKLDVLKWLADLPQVAAQRNIT